MLTVEHLSVRIAAASILEDVVLEVRPASLTALMGRNGAGKTTFMRSVMGLIPCPPGIQAGGEIWFEGREGIARELGGEP